MSGASQDWRVLASTYVCWCCVWWSVPCARRDQGPGWLPHINKMGCLMVRPPTPLIPFFWPWSGEDIVSPEGCLVSVSGWGLWTPGWGCCPKDPAPSSGWGLRPHGVNLRLSRTGGLGCSCPGAGWYGTLLVVPAIAHALASYFLPLGLRGAAFLLC